MSPILTGIIASGISGNLTPPWAPYGAYDALSTVTVPSGGVASITFAAIPQGYKHLQVRHSCISNRTTFAIEDLTIRFNGDTGANYSYHLLRGNGSTAAAGAAANASFVYLDVASGTSVSNYFGVGVTDILDYADTSKFKTTRSLTGIDTNGSVAGEFGRVALQSGNWRNTVAINSMVISPLNGTQFNQHSQFTLYGVR